MRQLKQLNQVAAVLMGQSPSSNACSEDGSGLPFIQGNAEFGVRYPTPRLRCSVPTRICENGDYLLSVRAPVGELNQSNMKMVIGRGLSAIRFSDYDQQFAWHSLKSAVHKLNRVAQGSTFVAVNRHDVECLEIPWFSEECNRQHVAYVLDTIDEAIAKTEVVITKLKQVRAGMLHDLLSYGLDENGQLRDPIAHPEQFKDSPLGRVPRAWDLCTLDSLGRWAGGKTPSKANIEFWSPALSLWVTPKDVKDTKVVNTEDKLSLIGSSIMEIFPAGSLLVVGRSGILRHTLPVATVTSPFTINQDLKVLVPNCHDDEPIAEFLLLVLLSRDQDILRRCVKVGTTVESIDWKDFKNLLVGWPSQSERIRICQHVETVDNKLSLFADVLRKLKNLKFGLQDDLLTGRVRVTESIREGAAST